MKKLLKGIINLLLKKASDILPSSFEEKEFYGVSSVLGNYVLPINYDFLSLNIQNEVSKGYAIEDKKVFVLENVLVSPGGIVFKNFKLFPPTIINAKVKSVLNHSFLLRQFVKPDGSVISFNKPLILVHDEWSKNYYHWMIDLLPKLLILADHNKEYTLILPEYDSDYVSLTISAMGYHNFCKLKQGAFIKASTLIVPERTAIGTYQNPELLVKVRQLLINHLKLTPQRAFRKVYVSRAKAGKRRISNEDAIKPILTKYGFELVFFEELSFEQQVELMWQTDVLIGVHGANLVNILFLQQSSTLIELMNNDSLNLVYYRMASTLRLPYYMIPCSEVASEMPDRNDFDVEVSPIVLSKVLQQIFV